MKIHRHTDHTQSLVMNNSCGYPEHCLQTCKLNVPSESGTINTSISATSEKFKAFTRIDAELAAFYHPSISAGYP